MILSAGRGRVFQQGAYVALDARAARCGRVAAHDNALVIDQELGKVPLDRAGAEPSAPSVFQILIEGASVGAIDLYLGKHREGHVVVGATKLGYRAVCV